MRTRGRTAGGRKQAANGPTLGFEATMWAAADKLRGHMDAAEYKHVVLGLVFLKYISDAFERQHAKLEAAPHADPEDPDEYRAENVFWVPPEARWQRLQDAAKLPEIGELIDDAMDAIERENPSLKGVLPRDYARPTLDKRRLGELIDLIGTIALGEEDDKAKDVLGRVYEYFLGQFASKEGKKAGEFYTPRCIVRLLVEMIEPYRGRVYDPCCGSSGMFVQSEEFIRAHGGKLADISIFGQESNPTTWKLAKMNFAIRGLEANLGPKADDSFHHDLHPDLKADFILANPPFNMSDWGGERLRDDARWRFGTPPAGNANFAWVQHMIHHLSPTGITGFVLSNGSLSSNQSGEGEIRRNIVEADLVDCIMALPPQLFYGTAIPACLWFVAKDRSGKPTRGVKYLRDRRRETLFIDARKMGVMVSRLHRELTDEEIARIAGTYHAWRGELGAGEYADVPGFCKGATLEEIREHGHVLTPGRYVGAAETEDDDEPFDQKLKRLVAELEDQFAESARLEATIREQTQDPDPWRVTLLPVGHPRDSGISSDSSLVALLRNDVPTTGGRSEEGAGSMSFELVWQRIQAHQGELFRQVRGGQFTYQVVSGCVVPDRTNRMLPRSDFRKAHERSPLRGPGEIQDLQGPSYVYAILADPRIAAP